MSREERKEIIRRQNPQHYNLIPSALERRVDEYIFCPYCGEEIDNEDDLYPVSYHGDDIEEMDCPCCDKVFEIKERITREYSSKKMEDKEFPS